MLSSRPRYRSFIQDSARWNDFAFRKGDIVISTPPKCGTTWTQMLCALLIFQDPQLPQPLGLLSPWLDMLTRPKAEVFARLEAQQHRRFIKTHTPLDGLPLQDEVTYICVGRDPRDVGVSMMHHRENMDLKMFGKALREVIVRDGIDEPMAPPQDQEEATLEARFWHWIDAPSSITEGPSSLHQTLHHYEQALSRRDQENIVVMHYSDLKADCEGEMRRLAARLGIDVAEAIWPTLVEAASFTSMRARAEELVPNSDIGLWKEPDQFFKSGTGGHWRLFFDAAAQSRYEARITAIASPEVAEWAHFGWRGDRTSEGRLNDEISF